MRNKFSTILILLGVLLILSAAALVYYNQREAAEAGESAVTSLDAILAHFETVYPVPDDDETEEYDGPEAGVMKPLPPEYPDPYTKEMTAVEIDGYRYIGYLTIPSLNRMLPVMEEWDYARLRKAPCRFYGSTKTENMIVCAHNYSSHFGGIADLNIGEIITFTDMDGTVITYEVVEVTVLGPDDVEGMLSGGYPLTLFTCTYGGRSRVTVRCDVIE